MGAQELYSVKPNLGEQALNRYTNGLSIDEYFFSNFTIEVEYNWLNDWNRNAPRELAECLRRLANLSDDEVVVFFWMRKYGLETMWGVFSRNWRNFLYDDEAPILICPKTGFSILFGPNGAVFAGAV